MAGKGGAWKVAYADFVTAMMAFFLVMWLISQDQKVKESIAHYFAEPVGFQLIGRSQQPTHTGGLSPDDANGPVPGSRLRSGGRGIGDTTDHTQRDNETTIVSEWIFEDSATSEKWRQLAAAELQQARQKHPGKGTTVTTEAEAAASHALAQQLRDENQRQAEAQTTGLARELLQQALTRVDWDALAEEILWNVSDSPPRDP
jgi:flagellar motor protein MotB